MSTLSAKHIPEFNHENLLKKIDRSSDCWKFNGCITKSGYGQYSIKGSRFYVHRLIWNIFKGDLRSSMVIDHKCRNRSCCNPEHLREVTRRVNMIENSDSPSGINFSKESCVNGHPFNETNTYRYSRGRGCRICRRESNRKRRKNKI